MHSGAFKTLEEVVASYDGGEVANKPDLLKPLNLSGEERANLVAFLKSLSMGGPLLDEEPELPATEPWR